MPPFTVNVSRGRTYRLSAPSPDHIGDAIRSSGRPYENDLLSLLAPFVRPPQVVVDVGANIGNHSLYFALVRHVSVHAFEPNEMSRRYLEDNVALNSTDLVVIHPEALSDSPQTGRISTVAGNLGRTRVLPDPTGEVVVTHLDSFDFPLATRIAILKIDVEGSERRVLKGADRTLRTHKPLVAVEAPSRPEREGIDALMRGYGYRRLLISFGWTATHVYCPSLPRYAAVAARAALVKLLVR